MRLFFLSFCFLSLAAFDLFALEPDILLPLNRSEIVNQYASVTSVSSDNVSVAKAIVHKKGVISIVGNGIGTTYINLMSPNGNVLKRILVRVTEDLPGVRKSIRLLFPNELGVQVDYVNNSIVLSGSVSGLEVADRVERVVKSFLKNKDASLINLMKINTTQQVALLVRVGEIRRDELTKIGLSSGISKVAGSSGAYFNTDGFDTAKAAAGSYPSSTIGGVFNWFTNFIGGADLFGTLDMLERRGAFKLLASPVLAALSGENAKFMAGGELPIAVFNHSNNMASLDYKPFGVMLDFNPLVLEDNTIRLNVAQEVSEISDAASVVEYGYKIPAITTRKASTTVYLSQGESLMIAGLIKMDMHNTIRDVPGISKIPILGALFRSLEFRKGETEMVIAVSPYLINPVRHDDVKMPTFDSANLLNGLFLGKLYGPKDLSLEGTLGYILD